LHYTLGLLVHTANMSEDASPPFVAYYYNPSLAAAGIFVACFSVTFILHFFQMIRFRTWYFFPLVVGSACKFPPKYQANGSRTIWVR
jgi:hypothetical protein